VVIVLPLKPPAVVGRRQILVTSLLGTMIPLAMRRVPTLRRLIPGSVFEACKYFGSGVILSTGAVTVNKRASCERTALIASRFPAFIHLLEPAADEALNPDQYAPSVCRSCESILPIVRPILKHSFQRWLPA
jgi:hypothetical protein